MARQKKIKDLQVKPDSEVVMTTDTETVAEVDINEIELVQQEVDRARKELELLKIEMAELKAKPAREIDEQEKALIAKHKNFVDGKFELKAKIEAQKAYDCQMVTGKFINRRAPGQPAKLTYMKYNDDPVKWTTFRDGGVYTIPRGFADQINEYYYTPHFIQKQGDQELSDRVGENSAIAEVDTSNKRYAFVPVGFN